MNPTLTLILGILLDLILLGILARGAYKGYRRRIIKMTIPVVSFILSILIMNPLGRVVYNIFERDIKRIFMASILSMYGDNANSYNIYSTALNNGLMYEVSSIIAFIFMYLLISTLVELLLGKINVGFNNVALNVTEKIIGFILGIISAYFTETIIMAIFYVLINANDITFLKEIVTASHIGRLFYNTNPILRFVSQWTF